MVRRRGYGGAIRTRAVASATALGYLICRESYRSDGTVLLS